NEEDVMQTFKALHKELKEYSPLLVKKPAAIILTKLDTHFNEEPLPKIKSKLPQLTISSVRGDNLDALKDLLFELIKQAEALEEPE
ncbi:MAG: GTPase ObgE, partial [Calditrichia bacterium]|nr:GTPase ObgE [Calditrichia bacterium]